MEIGRREIIQKKTNVVPQKEYKDFLDRKDYKRKCFGMRKGGERTGMLARDR